MAAFGGLYPLVAAQAATCCSSGYLLSHYTSTKIKLKFNQDSTKIQLKFHKRKTSKRARVVADSLESIDFIDIFNYKKST